MSITFALAIYFICWWVVLFAVLPLRLGGERNESERDPFAEAVGAPANPRIGAKFLLTTIISAVVFAAIYAVFAFHLIRIGTLPS